MEFPCKLTWNVIPYFQVITQVLFALSVAVVRRKNKIMWRLRHKAAHFFAILVTDQILKLDEAYTNQMILEFPIIDHTYSIRLLLLNLSIVLMNLLYELLLILKFKWFGSKKCVSQQYKLWLTWRRKTKCALYIALK